MRAIQVRQNGGYEQLRPVELPQPRAADGEALIEIRAAAVNPLDDAVRVSRFPIRPIS